MTLFTGECLRCGAEFTRDLPGAFCSGCLPVAVRKLEEALNRYYASPGAVLPGDMVMHRDPRQMPGVPRSDDVR